MRSLVEVEREDGLAIVTMNDAAGRNALGETMVRELGRRFAALSADGTCHAVVLCGTSEVFSSGAPRELLIRLASGDLSPADVALASTLLDVPVPTIAAMEGHATGGGLALGLCADVVVVAKESRYGATFMNMGFTPGMGMTRLLEHVLSPAVAHELLYTGELRRGDAFEGRSGINHVVPRVDVRARALDIARRIGDKPRHALTLLKRALSAPRRAAFAHAHDEEQRMHRACFSLPETISRIEGEFLEDV